MKPKLDIATCSDNNYAEWCGVLFLSILQSNADLDLHFHIVGQGITDEKKAQLTAMVESHGANINYRSVCEEDFSFCPIWPENHVSKAAYFRLMLPELYPDVDRMLYLDCDIVVNGSLKLLAEMDMHGSPVGAVLAAGTGLPFRYNRLRYPQQYGYVNSGVLLIDCAMWRNEGYSRVCLETIAANQEKFVEHDQDCINVVFHKTMLHLPITYNLQDTMLLPEEKLGISYTYFDEIREAVANPVVIHYSGQLKPWMVFCPNKFADLFREIYQQYTGHPLKLQDTTVRNWQYYTKRVLSFLGILEFVKKVLTS